MGVMSCHRNGCESIMCDTYIYDVGYICVDCQKEFKQNMIRKIIYSEEILLCHIVAFMETEKESLPKNPYSDLKPMDIDNFFLKNTR